MSNEEVIDVVDNNEEESFPYISNELIEKIEDTFDIRKMIWYEKSRDTLMGIQQVVAYLREIHNQQLGKGE